MTPPRALPRPILDDPDVRAHYINKVMGRIDWPADATGCWIWQGQTHHHGHGNVGYVGDGELTNYMVHRIMFAWWFGDTELPLDHLCREPSCVNPMHLEPVTIKVNNRRSPINITTINAHKTQCVNGHPFDEANTYWSTRANGARRRHCRACQTERSQRYNVKRRAKRRAAKQRYV